MGVGNTDKNITRWNSQYLMMDRVIRIYQFIVEVHDDIRDNNPTAEERRQLQRLQRAMLNEHELLIAQGLLVLLRPVLEFTKMASSATHPVLPKLYLWVHDWLQ